MTISPAWASDGADGDDPWPANRLVTPGNPARSRLVTCLTGQTRPRMPYTGDPLDAKPIAAVVRWIQGGARQAEYERVVLPFFRARCLPCHSTASNGGNLALDSYEALRHTVQSYHAANARALRWEALYGAASGPATVPAR